SFDALRDAFQSADFEAIVARRKSQPALDPATV
ncbi:phenylalanine 4-monooxygenase, partial [Mesorhizobium sp. M00.F.Ca.ET.158.01.1.1]